MLRRLVLLLGVAVALLAALPASAAPARSSMLTLDGSRTAWTDLTLPTKTTFDYASNDAGLTSRGDYVGFFAEAIDQAPPARTAEGESLGLVSLRDFHGPGEPGFVVDLTPGHQWFLNPGRYRFYLVADGSASVKIPISGSHSYRLQPTRAAYSDAAVGANILVNPLEAANRQPLEVQGSRSLVFSSLLVGKFRAYVGLLAACVSAPGAACGSSSARGADGGYSGYILSPMRDIDFSFTLYCGPGVVRPGRYDGQQDATDAGTLQYASGASFSLTLA